MRQTGEAPGDKCGVVSEQTAGSGARLLARAPMAYIEGGSVDPRQRDLQLGWGIGLISAGMHARVASSLTRKSGVRKYNESSRASQAY